MLQKILRISIVFMLFGALQIKAQDAMQLQAMILDSTLTKNANAIVRSEDVTIVINSKKSITVKTKRVVTVLNKLGNGYANCCEGYDPDTKIKKAEATIYNALGKEIKKYKKKDFNDRSMYDGVSLIGDNRYIYFDYSPIDYPYTLVYESEVESKSTAFMKSWRPITGYYLSVEKSQYKIVNPSKIPLRSKEKYFEGYPVSTEKRDQQISYVLSKVPALRKEDNSPSFYDIVPNAKLALKDFSLVKVDGSATDWKSMGQWQYDNLVSGRDQLSATTVKEISDLVSDATTTKEKVKRIYEYVQNKTRYISIQLGIGGWMPMLAKDVDRLGYGDCKALTNYTKALLKVKDIPAYYTVVYGDKNKRNIDAEFASMQGNHVILNIPDGEEDIWLECTSQTLPFNFIGDFTDDRNVLVVKPEGGEIKRTKKYKPEENLLHTTATINLGGDKKMSATVQRISQGLEYDWNYGVQFKTPKDQKLYYKEYWGYINGLEINSIQYNDDRDTVKFTENINVSCSSYIKKIGTRLLVTPNLFSCDESNLSKYEDRKTPLVISRGYVNTDEYIINTPKGYAIGKMPEKKSINNEFGNYEYKLEKINENQIRFKRFLKIVDGTFPKEKYEEYRKFRSQIKKIDRSRIVLKQQ
ncbi:transglutaminase-like domain-containing protein [Aquimarina longa]|uniref:transglutaminase-like domain-containing protein n=1 Tax=Aquimarina longa TaxID=1080221 RepID=UPI000780C567|nr:transglutaminase family protein [Aquimarina longa]